MSIVITTPTATPTTTPTTITKKVLSFDVGIKNLAFCIIEKKITTDEFKILTWGIINLSGPTVKCDFIIRGGKPCESSARSQIYHKDKVLISNKETIHCCDGHVNKLIPTIVKLKKEKHQCNVIGCTDGATYHLTNTEFYWCTSHYNKIGKKVAKGIKTKKIHIKNANRESMDNLCTRMYTQFDSHPTFLTVDEILIENQPSMTNPTMKTVASFVFSYFILKKAGSSIKGVYFISPSNKLKVLEDKKVERSYKMTKKLGIKYCSALIEEEDKTFLAKFRKKDDMCDAFLQGFQYLFRPVPMKYIKKLEVVGFEKDSDEKVDCLDVAEDEVLKKKDEEGETKSLKKKGRPKKVEVETEIPKKKGRPRKVGGNGIIGTEAEVGAKDGTEANNDETPKKKGRPKKIKVEMNEDKVPKKKGRPRKMLAENRDEGKVDSGETVIVELDVVDDIEEVPKKKGRPKRLISDFLQK